MNQMKSSPKKRGGTRPAKGGARLGQHFLTSSSIAKTIAESSGAKKGSLVLEVGPGKGILTKEILSLGANVTAIEKDSQMIQILKEVFQGEIKSKQLKLVEGDARTFINKNIPTKKYSVAANIPYYITGELIRLFLTAKKQPETISLLIQKEVAQRIVKSKKESILSLSVKAYGTPVYVKTVKAGSFNPPPSVDSAILKIENVSRKNFKKISEKDFFELLHIGFGQKRKTLLGNLRKGLKNKGDELEKAWEKLSLDKNIRAEDLPLEVWIKLTSLI